MGSVRIVCIASGVTSVARVVCLALVLVTATACASDPSTIGEVARNQPSQASTSALTEPAAASVATSDPTWPAEAWTEAPLPASANPDAVAAVIADAFDSDASPFGTIHAAVVIKEGALVFERYGNGYDGIEPHVSWSVATGVAHALLGVLVRDGRVDVMAPATIPEWDEPGDPRAAITPDMLTRMSSGLEWDEGRDAAALFTSTGFAPAAVAQIDRPLAAEPDSVFNYSTGSTAILGRIMGDLVGTGADFETWANGALFGPLGITSVELEYDINGYWIAGYGANMTARDFARFGLLYLRDGIWDGQQLLPEGWVSDARSPSTNPDYGAGFWLNLHAEDSFSAEGFQGQKVIVLPEEDLIVVVLASNADDELTTMFANNLIDALT